MGFLGLMSRSEVEAEVARSAAQLRAQIAAEVAAEAARADGRINSLAGAVQLNITRLDQNGSAMAAKLNELTARIVKLEGAAPSPVPPTEPEPPADSEYEMIFRGQPAYVPSPVIGRGTVEALADGSRRLTKVDASIGYSSSNATILRPGHSPVSCIVIEQTLIPHPLGSKLWFFRSKVNAAGNYDDNSYVGIDGRDGLLRPMIGLQFPDQSRHRTLIYNRPLPAGQVSTVRWELMRTAAGPWVALVAVNGQVDRGTWIDSHDAWRDSGKAVIELDVGYDKFPLTAFRFDPTEKYPGSMVMLQTEVGCFA